MKLTVTWQELAQLLELRKKRAECEFKLEYLKWRASKESDIKNVKAELDGFLGEP